MTKFTLLPFTAALLVGTTLSIGPAFADPRPTAQPQPAARPIQPRPADCPSELPIARLRWNWNHGNQEAVIQFLRRCFPELLDGVVARLKAEAA